MNREALDRRKSLLIAQSHLHRLQAGMAWHDVKEAVLPPRPAPERGDRARSIAATLLSVAIPVFGLARLGRITRAMSVAVIVMRLVRGFRGRR
jgi:hypothetical protein